MDKNTKETIEQAAEAFVNYKHGQKESGCEAQVNSAFLAGALWQSQQQGEGANTHKNATDFKTWCERWERELDMQAQKYLSLDELYFNYTENQHIYPTPDTHWRPLPESPNQDI